MADFVAFWAGFHRIKEMAHNKLCPNRRLGRYSGDLIETAEENG